jgi:hypothetical protein
VGQDETVKRLIDHAADIWVALKGIAHELDLWNALPAQGTISINGVVSMTTTDVPTNIPSDNCAAKVDWFDRLNTAIPHDKTQTNWSAEDDTGAPSSAVSINPNLDQDSDDETATVVFVASSGLFKVVATTDGASGPIRAESAVYNIQPGAPAVGMITLSPI